MRVVFTYLPIRLKELTEIYLKYSNYNFAAVSFSCKEVAQEIKKHYPNFR